MSVFNIGITDKDTDKLIYVRWQRMLERCFSPSYKEKFPSYNTVTVCDDFLYYSKFESWMKEQDNFFEYINGGRAWALDKDLFCKEGKIYSQATCCLLPSEINGSLICYRDNGDGTPSGISFQNSSKKFIVSLSVNGKNKNLGRFTCQTKAFEVYCIAKDEKIRNLAEKWKESLTDKAYNHLVNYSEKERSLWYLNNKQCL